MGEKIKDPSRPLQADAIARVAAARTAIGETHAQEPFDHTGAPR